MNDDLHMVGGDPSLYNKDLAPIPMDQRGWGAFQIFNVWNRRAVMVFGLAAIFSVVEGRGSTSPLSFTV